MRRLVFILFLFFTPLVIISQDYNQPNNIEVVDAEYDYGSGTNFPEFRPIGWSKNGYFVYQIILSEGGFGVYENSINIISAKTDQILASISLIDEETHDGSGNENGWLENKKEINRMLSEYKIDDRREIEFYSKNTIEDFSVSLKKIYAVCDDAEYGEKNVDFEIVVRNKNFGKKIVSSGSLECMWSVNIEGYIISPFEDRILIILSSLYRGFEGEEDYYIDFIGCSLDPSTFK